MRNKFTILFLSCFLSACSTLGIGSFEPLPPLNLPSPEVLSLEPVTFTLVHKDNSATVFAEMEANKQEPLLIGLTGTDYKNLAVNVSRLKAYILVLKKQLELYKGYYEPKENKESSR